MAPQSIGSAELRKTAFPIMCVMQVGGAPGSCCIPFSSGEPEQVLVDQMALDPSQSQVLFDLLVRNEVHLKRMAEAEEEECDQALAGCAGRKHPSVPKPIAQNG